MSPFFKALPTAFEARSNAVRSGRRAWSMGVGTVTMKKSALLSSPGSDVKTRLERARSLRLDLAGAVAAGLEFGNPRGIDIEADDSRPFAAERHGDRQPDIPESDDGKLATVRHDFGFDAILCRSGLSYPALGGVRNGAIKGLGRASADRARPRHGRYAHSKTCARPVRGWPCRI